MGFFDSDEDFGPGEDAGKKRHDADAETIGRRLARKHGVSHYSGPILIGKNGVVIVEIDGMFVDSRGNTWTHEHKNNRRPQKVERQTRRSREIIGDRYVHTYRNDDGSDGAEYYDAGSKGFCYIITASSLDPALYNARNARENGRWGIRDNKPIWVSDQVITAKSFETLLKKLYPSQAALIKDFYDTLGPVVANVLIQNDDAKASARATLDELTESYTEILQALHVEKDYGTFVVNQYSPKTDEDFFTIQRYVQGVHGDAGLILPVKKHLNSSWLSPSENGVDLTRRLFRDEVALEYEDVKFNFAFLERLKVPNSPTFQGVLAYAKNHYPEVYLPTSAFYQAFFKVAEHCAVIDPALIVELGVALRQPLKTLETALHAVDMKDKQAIDHALHVAYC
ncbi:hypothetical protein C4573_04045 [Candidatus Woesearchaeota archaeon]|nr:MAG: hypothetical protein C4573_04045 [Candidatus Woesearchaeota archaeon]